LTVAANIPENGEYIKFISHKGKMSVTNADICLTLTVATGHFQRFENLRHTPFKQ